MSYFNLVLKSILTRYNSRPEVFLRKGVLKICSKFTGEYPCRSVISIELHSNFIETHFGMGVLLWICCIFSEHLFLRIPLDGCFWRYLKNVFAKCRYIPLYKMPLRHVCKISSRFANLIFFRPLKDSLPRCLEYLHKGCLA